MLSSEIREMLRALAVLALAFLNFGHAPIAVAAPTDGYAPFVATSFCGAPLDSERHAPGPCHACRIGGGAAVPPPVGMEMPAFGTLAVVYGTASCEAVAAPRLAAFAARGPPRG